MIISEVGTSGPPPPPAATPGMPGMPVGAPPGPFSAAIIMSNLRERERGKIQTHPIHETTFNIVK